MDKEVTEVTLWLEEPRTDFPYQFCCSFSPLLRRICDVFPQVKEFIREQCYSTVRYFEESAELCASLKTNILPQEGRLMRQFDIKKTANGPAFLKFFMSWQVADERWLVLVELAEETFWEKNQINPAVN